MNYEPSEVSYNIPESVSDSGDAKNVLVRMPKTISTAINNITKEIKMLGKDGNNELQKYHYASIDKFLSTVNPLAGHF